MSGSQSVQPSPIVTPDSAVDAIRRSLRSAVLVEKRFTVRQIADESGVSLSSVECYMRNDNTKVPSLANALSIAVVLGPKAVNAVMALIGYSAAPLDEADAVQPMQIVADSITHFAVIAQAAADNRIDHVEMPNCQAAADAIIATVLPLSSAGKAQ